MHSQKPASTFLLAVPAHLAGLTATDGGYAVFAGAKNGLLAQPARCTET